MIEDIQKFVSDRIQILRDNKGVSARDMSLSLGQNHSYINQIENGLSLPSIEGLTYICDYFGITLAQFFDENQKLPDCVNLLLAEIKNLDKEGFELLISLARRIKK